MNVNLISVILTIIMAFTGICGGLQGAGVKDGYSVELKASLDGDLSAMIPDENTAKQVSLVQSLLDAISLRLVAGPESGQLDINGDEGNLASLSVKKQEDGSWASVSTLFPSSIVTVSSEFINAAMAQVGGLLPGSAAGLPGTAANVDLSGILAEIQPQLTEMIVSYTSAFGETETGSFTIQGVEYTKRTPFTMTAKEAVTLALTTLKTILENQGVQSLLSSVSPGFSTSGLDDTLENIQNTSEEDAPVLNAAKYENEDGDNCFDLSLSKDPLSILFTLATSKGITRATLKYGEQLDASFEMDPTARSFALNVTAVPAPGQNVAVNASLKLTGADSGTLQLDLNVPMPLSAKAIGAKVEIKFSKAVPVFEASEDLKTVVLDQLKDGSDEMTSLNAELVVGLSTVALRLMNKVPAIRDLLIPATPVSK